MNILKKLTIVSLLISVLLTGFCFNASALVIYEDDFGFTVNTAKREATLVSYTGNDELVEIPDYFQGYPVRSIDRNAFSGNKTIKEIKFSNANTTVEEYAFMDCTSLETVYIPENVVSFGDRVFANCTSLKNVTLLSNMVSVPSNMFLDCSSLENLTLSNSIAEFGYGCFNGCSSLKSLDFVSNGALLQSYSFNGTGAESVVLSDSLIAIPDHAFTNCPNLKFAAIPESVLLIQPNSFDFENITIGCYYDSYAYAFAKENGYSYKLLNEIILGDTSGDGIVNINDVTVIQQHLAEFDLLSELSGLAADVNQDGKTDIEDATIIQMFLAEYSVRYPIGSLIQ